MICDHVHYDSANVAVLSTPLCVADEKSDRIPNGKTPVILWNVRIAKALILRLIARINTLYQKETIMDDVLESIENLPSSVYYGGVFGSIILSLGLYLSGRRQAGIFVGLWAPTILNLGLYNKLLRPSQEPEMQDFE